jgi:hypothetical protein
MDICVKKHAERVNEARNQLAHLHLSWEQSTGPMKEHYKGVILDRLWKLSQMSGEFYHMMIAAIGKVENEVMGGTIAGQKYLEATIAAMAASYKSSAPPESDP